MNAVLLDCRRAAVSEEGIEIEGEIRGESATRIVSHDRDDSVYKVKREILTAHEQTESVHRLPLTRRSKRSSGQAYFGCLYRAHKTCMGCIQHNLVNLILLPL